MSDVGGSTVFYILSLVFLFSYLLRILVRISEGTLYSLIVLFIIVVVVVVYRCRRRGPRVVGRYVGSGVSRRRCSG